MRGHHARQFALVIEPPQCADATIKLIRLATLLQRQIPAAMMNDIRIREIRVRWRTERRVVEPVSGLLFRTQIISREPAVSISRTSVLKEYRVDHASAVERIRIARIGFKARIRPVAHEHAIQAIGNLALNLQVGVVALIEYRLKCAA